VLKSRIRVNVRLAEAPSHGKSIHDYAPGSNGSKDFMNLAKEVLEILPAAASPEVEAQLTAIENYYRVSRSEQKIRPEDIRQPVREMRTTIEDLRGVHEKLREAIADAKRDATAAGGIGDVERETTKKLTEALQRELALEKRVIGRLSGNDRVQVERMVDLLGRCDAIETQLYAFDKRIDAQVSNRLTIVNQYLAAGKEELGRASDKLGSIMEASKSMGGGLAQAMFTKVADKFYDLVVRSDVGIIDVSWGLKDQKTQAVTRLTNQKSMEIKALDEDFRKVLEEDK